jgi:hypothetical protein
LFWFRPKSSAAQGIDGPDLIANSPNGGPDPIIKIQAERASCKDLHGYPVLPASGGEPAAAKVRSGDAKNKANRLFGRL